MADKLNETPNANRVHIGFFGRRNAGKSTLVNTVAGQKLSIVSDTPGTTTDPVYKAMEIYPIGACVVIDTAGFDDEGSLGASRIEKTKLAAEKSDIAVVIFSRGDLSAELAFCADLRARKVPLLAVINTFGKDIDYSAECRKIREAIGENPLMLDAAAPSSRELITAALARLLPENYGEYDITRSLVKAGDTVLLVMPQDIQAPRGRLILPQVQTLRELLDKKCITVSTTADKISEALSMMKAPPKLIITDSQVFKAVHALKPAESLLTSFSVLFAALKGDIAYYKEGAEAIAHLTESSRVLIAECCTHAPLAEDIGRVKLPRILRQKIGQGLSIDFVSGTDFPKDPSGYDLIIQCGACMFNRKYVLTRIEHAKNFGVPMTNYGVALAYLNGILPEIATAQ